MIEKEFAELVEARGLCTLGTNAYIGEPDDDKDTCYWFMLDPSDEPDRYLETRYATISVWSRHKTAATAANALEAVDHYFHRMYGVQTTSYYIHFIHTAMPQVDMGRDTKRRKLYMMKFRVIYRKLNEVS